MAVRESGVVAAIQRAIVEEYPEAWVFKVHGSAYQMAGVPDLLVVVDGLLTGIEVKYQRPGESLDHARSRVSAQQQVQIDRLREAGAVAGVVTSPEEALALVAESFQTS